MPTIVMFTCCRIGRFDHARLDTMVPLVDAAGFLRELAVRELV